MTMMNTKETTLKPVTSAQLSKVLQLNLNLLHKPPILQVLWQKQGASTQLELAISKIIAPECKTALGRAILQGDLYVDDVLSFHDDVHLLLAALNDIEETLKNHGFLIKRIIRN